MYFHHLLLLIHLWIASWIQDPVHSADIVLHPTKRSIVLVGHRTTVQVFCEELNQDICLEISPVDAGIVKVLTKELNITSSETAGQLHQNSSEPHSQIRLLGVNPGSTKLKIEIQHAANRSLMGHLQEEYTVTVVRRVDVVQDAFMYVLSATQIMVLFLLGWRMRSAAVREVLCRPCTLIAAILCQTLLMPLVTLGASIALSLPVHSVVSMLIVGCCPTGVLSPMFAVLQQAHVELGVVLLLVETAAAFGAMPLWLFTYGHFLGLAYTNVAFPYLHIAGALVAVAGPIILGLAMQRCTPRALPGVDKAIQPTCLLLVLVACTVRLYATWRHWELVTWRLLLSCLLVPVAGAIMGLVATAIFRQKLPQVKTVAIVTSLQNTLLATVILQTSFPASDASLMAVTVTCLEVMSQALMVTLYIVHVAVWLSWPYYRSRHDSIGISGAYRSIGERIVKSMIKAGEITLLRATGSPASGSKSSAGKSTPPSTTTRLGHILVPGQDGVFKFGTIGLRKSGFSSSMDTICRSQNSLAESSTGVSGDLSLKYFGSSADASPSSLPRSDPDSRSLSIDYAMLDGNKTPDVKQDGGKTTKDDGAKTEVRERDGNVKKSAATQQQQQKPNKDTPIPARSPFPDPHTPSESTSAEEASLDSQSDKLSYTGLLH